MPCKNLAIPSSTEPDLLPTIRQAFPTVESYTIMDEIVQPNAVGFKVQLNYNDDSLEEDAPKTAFVKTVAATDYVANRNDWSDLRRLLMYCRTESRFYQEFTPILRQAGFHSVPEAYFVDYNLEDWVGEDEEAAAEAANPNVDKDSLPDARYKGSVIVMECVPSDTYFQDSPLTIEQSKQCLTAAADLHAAAWQKTDLLERAQSRLSQASFHLSMRNPKELANIEAAWDHFCVHFRQDMMEVGVWNDSVHNLGSRIAKTAVFISQAVTRGPRDDYSTLIHGDYKSMNVLLAKDPEAGAVLVDYASVGIGLGMSDVAMHIHHAVLPEDLEGGGEEELVRHYWQALMNHPSMQTGDTEATYPYEVALQHYRFAVVDYFRFFLGRMWKTATHETMDKKKDNKNVNLINRSVPAACAYVGRVDKYLSEIERVYEEQQLHCG